MRQSLATRLGIELVHPDPVERSDRLRQLEQRNGELAADLDKAQGLVRHLEDELTGVQDDLTAAREGLRRITRQRATAEAAEPLNCGAGAVSRARGF